MNKLIIVLFLIIVIAIFGYYYMQKPVVSAEDHTTIETLQEPQQYRLFDFNEFSFNSKDLEATIKTMAKYKISAVILNKKRYASGWESKVSPFDLALGWGKVSDPENLKHIKVSQTLRWYQYKFDRECELTHNYISTHSSNHHIIPANENIRKAIQLAKKYDKIFLEGYLVNVSGKYKNGNVQWRTSLVRTDTGNHSCEIMYVESVKLGSNIYR